MKHISEVYQNSPLVEVVCEIRFPADLSIESYRCKFHDSLKNEYPNILVPPCQSGKAIALEPYRFETREGTSGVMISINKFSYYTKKYEGHKKFIEEFCRLSELLFKTYSVNSISRLGWRYINIIPFSREEGSIPISHFFNIDVVLPGSIPKRFEKIDLTFVSKISNGSITIKLGTLLKEDGSQEAFLLDFDFAQTERLTISNLRDSLNGAHSYTRTIFEEIITEPYRQYLRGEEL